MPVRVRLTYKDLEQLPEDDGKKYELHEGDLFVTAAPRLDHQEFAGELFVWLRDFVRRNRLGKVYQHVDVSFSDDTVYTPDIAFVGSSKAGQRTRRFVRGAPDLVVEVLSPTTEARDRRLKLQSYARHGGAEYWLCDADARRVEVLVLRGGNFEILAVFGENDTLRSEVLKGLEIPLEEVWPERLPEE